MNLDNKNITLIITLIIICIIGGGVIWKYWDVSNVGLPGIFQECTKDSDCDHTLCPDVKKLACGTGKKEVATAECIDGECKCRWKCVPIEETNQK